MSMQTNFSKAPFICQNSFRSQNIRATYALKLSFLFFALCHAFISCNYFYRLFFPLLFIYHELDSLSSFH
jgi:hypothetical protein